jgi:microcystin-dependent protein
MAEPFIGEIRVFPFNTVPKGWVRCEGQNLPINSNQALYSLLGTMYGGNGVSTFALPDLRGLAPLHTNQQHPQGQAGGETTHALTVNEMPAHSHTVAASTADGTASTPTGGVWAGSGSHSLYANSPDTGMNPQAVAQSGGSQPHNNMQPSLALSFCIALQGIYPQRN